MSIALVRGDSIVWKAAFGFANTRSRTPATTETIYSTGSSFKSVTATAVMQLVEQRKIKLDDPINQYLGESQERRHSLVPRRSSREAMDHDARVRIATQAGGGYKEVFRKHGRRFGASRWRQRRSPSPPAER